MRRTQLVVLAIALAFTAACKKKTAAVPPPPPVQTAPPETAVVKPALQATPRVTAFTAEPSRIERGQSITLRWATTDAQTVTIDQGIGNVAANGTRQLSPTQTTTYAIIARNGDRSDTRTVTVEVTAPRVVEATKQTAGPDVATQVRELTSQLQDMLFDYDMSELRDDTRRAANTDADLLKRIFALDPRVNFVVEGHADERGSAEYNLGLGDRRALVARDALVGLGVPANRLRTISFGEEAPVCRDSNEDCWQRNRRAHLSQAQ